MNGNITDNEHKKRCQIANFGIEAFNNEYWRRGQFHSKAVHICQIGFRSAEYIIGYLHE